MNDDARPNGGEADRDDGPTGPAAAARDGTVTSTYTDISGRPVYVLAAVDREDAWIAVPRGVERDTAEFR